MINILLLRFLNKFFSFGFGFSILLHKHLRSLYMLACRRLSVNHDDKNDKFDKKYSD